MKSFKRARLIAGALALGLTGLVYGETETSTAAELQALRAEIAQLRATQNENWLNERRAEEVKTLVREVLADADTRASLLEGGLTGGYNGQNFFLSSDDGSFLLNVAGQIQVRYIWNQRDDAGNSFVDEDQTGFDISRAKLDFFGHVGDPRIGYQVRLSANNNTSAVNAEVVKLSYKLTDALTLEGGRFKGPFLREELISSGKQLAVERSVVNELFTTGYQEGVGLTWASEQVVVSAMLNDGRQSGEVGGVFAAGQAFNNDASDYAVTARADVKLLGSWDQAADFTSWQGEETSLVVGGAVHYEVAETGDNQAAGFQFDNLFQWTVDASYESNGFGLYGAIVNAITDGSRDALVTENLQNWGLVVQGSYNINNKLEPFVRWEWIDLDDIAAIGFAGDDFHVFTVGANYYLRGHAAKLTLDVVYAPDAILATNLGGVNRTGLFADQLSAGGTRGDDQVAVRAQFQLLF